MASRSCFDLYAAKKIHSVNSSTSTFTCDFQRRSNEIDSALVQDVFSIGIISMVVYSAVGLFEIYIFRQLIDIYRYYERQNVLLMYKTPLYLHQYANYNSYPLGGVFL